ncbi:EscI/YscI/HrpB family type III secretion system inner rod protein [Chitinimonas arctica]|uniref:EscI/YscI/HrpB family type III secretion system inner rod protein n=1 Tax=Chitinimonas arctica TaxID=2594795 RepID=A0A516SA94_9NEIS|nr:type III secretion system inner rod subunit SctI [Chitinimonas arctica]QDQ25073.1 EscI/YscI/HrpB family type III secretion system inner rod protein [Chitinimonas arctica]
MAAIEALNMASASASVDPVKPRLESIDPADIEKFNRALYGQPGAETSILKDIQTHALGLSEAMESGKPTMGQFADPKAMLDAQTKLMKMVLDVEMTSKVAGSLSQSINKLVNLQ